MDKAILSLIFKALSDKTRLEILRLIYQGNACGCELIHELDISQPTLSHHLKILKDAQLIKGIRHKTKTNYTVNLKYIQSSYQALEELLKKKISC